MTREFAVRLGIPLALGLGLVLVVVGGLKGGRMVPVAQAAPIGETPPTTSPITRYVAITGTNALSCATPGDACRTIQYAVNVSSPGDVIKVAAGVYTDVHPRPPAPFFSPAVVTQVVYLSMSVTIRGGYTTTDGFADPPDPAVHPTTLDARGQGRVLYIAGDVQPVVEGLRLTGGDATGLGGSQFAPQVGGGVYVLSATATLSNNEIFSNTAGNQGAGGGFFAYRSGSLLQGNVILANQAGSDGGGLYIWSSPVVLAGNLITANTAITWGGGLFMSDCPATLDGNRVQANEASFGAGFSITGCEGALLKDNVVVSNTAIVAGGMYMGYTGWTTRATIISNTFSYNTALAGTGIYLMYVPSDFIGNEISYNDAVYWAAGLYSFSGETLFDRNVFRGNTSGDEGGGGYIEYSPITMVDNLFADNVARDGGGLFLYGCEGVLRGNTLSANSAGRGGGALLGYSTPVVEGNLITGNTAFTVGGGLLLSESHATLLSNTITANTTGLCGGGVLLSNSDDLLINNVIADNQTDQFGAGVCVADSAPRLLHTTIARNGGGDGSGVYVTNWETVHSAATLSNTILISHTLGITVAEGCTATLEATLWGNGTDWDGAGAILTGSVNLWGDPAFVDPGHGDYHIGLGSAAFDAGIDAGVTSDIDGEVRPFAQGYDIGADEVVTSTCIPIVDLTFLPTRTTLFSPTTFTPIVTPDDATPPLTYTWDFGDGSPPVTDPHPVHAYDCGPYTVTLTAANGCSQRTVLQPVQVTGPPCCVPPEAGFTTTPPLLAGVPITFTNLTTWCTFYPIIYTWDFGDGSPVVTAVHPVHTYAAAGRFTVWLTADMYCGCDDWVSDVYSGTLVVDVPVNVYLPLILRGGSRGY